MTATIETFIPETGIESSIVRPSYLRDYDASNGGLSSRHDTLLIVRPGTRPCDLTITDADRAVVISSRCVSGGLHPYLEPITGQRAGHVGWMASGVSVGIGPSLRAELERLGTGIPDALDLHDRQESRDLYAQMSI